MTPQHDRDELRQEILKTGLVRKGLLRWPGKPGESVKVSGSNIVEIPIDDLMQLLDTHVAAIEREARIDERKQHIELLNLYGTPRCEYLHHSKNYQHEISETCPVEKRIAQLRTTQEADSD